MNANNQFSGFTTLDQIKSKYKSLVEHLHPRGENGIGDMKQLNAITQEYLEITKLQKFNEFEDEVKDDFINFPKLVSELIYLEVKLEVCGSWLWVNGPTVPNGTVAIIPHP